MNSATRATVAALGTLMGIAGIEHGIGEVLQGSTAPDGIVFPSWPESPFFRAVAGEPAMSLVPSFRISGILAIVLSCVFIAWAMLFVQRKHGGWILVLLAIAMLLVGGGFFPPIIGILIGILGTRINAPLAWWRMHLSVGLQRFLGRAWPWSFTASLIGWLCLFPGISILGYFFGLSSPALAVALIFLALGSLLLAIICGFSRDIQRQGDYPAA